VALTGRSTNAIRRRATLSSWPAAWRSFAQSDQVDGALGSSLNGDSAKTRRLGEDLDIGQQGRQGPRGRRLGCAALAADEHAADPWIDGVEDQRALHALLTDDGCKWK